MQHGSVVQADVRAVDRDSIVHGTRLEWRVYMMADLEDRMTWCGRSTTTGVWRYVATVHPVTCVQCLAEENGTDG